MDNVTVSPYIFFVAFDSKFEMNIATCDFINTLD